VLGLLVPADVVAGRGGSACVQSLFGAGSREHFEQRLLRV
jgi:hypothetical protein